MARPPIYDTASTARIDLRVTPAQFADLRQVARENGVSVAAVIREAVVEYIAEHDERKPVVRK